MIGLLKIYHVEDNKERKYKNQPEKRAKGNTKCLRHPVYP